VLTKLFAPILQINGIQGAGLEHHLFHTVTWNGTTIGCLIGYVCAMLFLYSLAPILFRLSSSPFYNLCEFLRSGTNSPNVLEELTTFSTLYSYSYFGFLRSTDRASRLRLPSFLALRESPYLRSFREVSCESDAEL
jgi:hypothetical protein